MKDYPHIVRYWDLIEKYHKPGSFAVLSDEYSEPFRRYHGFNHLEDMLTKLDTFQSLAHRPLVIATAIFWHDVILRSRWTEAANVSYSQVFFENRQELPILEADAVFDMIGCTADHMNPSWRRVHYRGFVTDLWLFLDLDLSCFAVPPDLFDENERKIRAEYQWVDDVTFAKGRAVILQRFLEKFPIYRTPELVTLWSGAAKRNLERRITELEVTVAA